MSKLREEMQKLDTHPDLMEMMLEGFKAVVNDHDPDSIPVKESMKPLAEAQAKVGWKQLLKGRLVVHWQHHQQKHLGEEADEKKKNGQTWSANMATLLLQLWLELWQARNGDRHGRDRESRAEARKCQAIYELHQLYSHKDDIPLDISWILRRPIEECLQWPSYMIRAFVNSYKPVIDGSLKAHQTDPNSSEAG